MRIVNTYTELMNYLRDFSEQHPDINYFVFGDSDKILSLDRSLLKYPVLWVETPIVNWVGLTGIRRDYSVSFVVLENAAIDDWEKEAVIFNRSLDITGHILQWMQDDKEAGLINVDLRNVQSNPVATYGHDNDNGYRTTVNFIGIENACAPACKRQLTCPVGTLAKFSWNNASAGNFSELSIINETLPADEAWEWEWSWRVDNGPAETSTDEVPVISTDGNSLYLQLKIASGDCVRYASTQFNNQKNCGESSPLIINKTIC